MSDLLTTFKQGDATWEKLRQRCRDDLYWFASVVLAYGDKIPMRPDVHGPLCRFLERKTGSPLLDTARYRKIEMPRETGKSVLARAYAIQRIVRDRNVAILLINEKELLAKDFLFDIKWQFENNQLLRGLFPEIIPPELKETTWSATRIVVNRTTGRPDPTIDVAGVGAALAGKHPDVIIGDDIISREAMENARAGSWQIMYQTNRWINQLDPIVNKSAEPCPEITFIGTRWWHNDSYEYIEKAYGYEEDHKPVMLRVKRANGTTVQIPTYRVGDLAVFRRAAIEDGHSIFPEKWSLEDLAKIRLRDSALFAANYMNRPADDVTATFKEDWLKSYHWLDTDQLYFTNGEGKREVRNLTDMDILILVDPGGFGERGTEDRARPAAVVLGDDRKGNHFFLDCYSEPDTFLAACREIVMFAKRYPTTRRIYSERAGQQVAFAHALRQELLKENILIAVDDTKIKPEGKAKELRIMEMEPIYQRGVFYVGTGPKFHEFKRQYSQFPRGDRVDILDVLGYYPRLIRKSSGTTDAATRQAQQLSAYRMRRAYR